MSAPRSSSASETLADAISRVPPIASDDPLRLSRFVSAVATSLDVQAAPEPTLHLVTFALSEELYALPVERVREVVRVQGLARVPQAPDHVRGVQPLRGGILPVLEVKTRLGLPPVEVKDGSRILVVEGSAAPFGLLVDSVAQVQRVPKSRVQPPPPEVRSQLSAHVAGTVALESRIALLLDLERLLVLPRVEEPSK